MVSYIITFITEHWLVISGVAGLIGTAVTWLTYGRFKKKKDVVKLKLDSQDAMFKQIEKLSLKLTELLNKRVEDAEENARLNMIINRLELGCPDCVGKILKIIEEEESAS